MDEGYRKDFYESAGATGPGENEPNYLSGGKTPYLIQAVEIPFLGINQQDF